MYAAILAGGVGSRLWPRSRQAHPKQFADIAGTGRTMIQATVDRLDGMIPNGAIYVLTGQAYATLAAQQLPALARTQIVAEPSGRNTAPAIGLAALHLYQRDPDAVLVVLPADHIIADTAAFQRALRRAEGVARAGWLVTLGIEPEFAHTGYGYIQRSTPLIETAESMPGDLAVYEVAGFHEKPDSSTAQRFLEEGGYYWNGGIFVFRAADMLAEIERQAPEIHAALSAIGAAQGTPEANAVFAAEWQRMPSISIDYAVMEHAQRLAVVPLNAGWSDVGSWDALEEVLPADAAGNAHAHDNIIAIDASRNVIISDKHVVALIGVEDLVIVESGDALLIGHKQQMQKVKEVVESLRAQDRTDLV